MKKHRAPAVRVPRTRRTAMRNAPALEWLEDLSGRSARITSIGSRSLLVENHSGIAEFSDAHIVLRSRCGLIEISGSGLTLNEVRRDALTVHGRIRHVELPCSEDPEHES